MLEPNRIKQKEKFNSILDLGNNNYYYNYDIKPDIILANDIEHKDISGFSAIQVYIHGKPDYKTCVRAVIRAYISPDEEFDLINSFNRDQIQHNTLSSNTDKYLNYLNLVDTIKQNVKQNFNI